MHSSQHCKMQISFNTREVFSLIPSGYLNHLAMIYFFNIFRSFFNCLLYIKKLSAFISALQNANIIQHTRGFLTNSFWLLESSCNDLLFRHIPFNFQLPLIHNEIWCIHPSIAKCKFKTQEVSWFLLVT